MFSLQPQVNTWLFVCYTSAMQQRIIQKVGLAFFKDNKIIMVKTDFGKEAYYFLGGTIEIKESDLECLIREVKEEVSADIVEGSVKFLEEFTAPAHGRIDTLVTMKLYSGELVGNIKPSSEVTGIVYCNSSLASKHHTPLSKVVFPWLKENQLID